MNVNLFTSIFNPQPAHSSVTILDRNRHAILLLSHLLNEAAMSFYTNKFHFIEVVDI